ncbi:hypothetical protein [Nocardioides sp.]|jgi:hypothetical protein|uniref:hypothetical protein n=1 Tax=Nocardioides sp. TaxID=35761 RepID=UPI00262DE845|nr:hypothetical protein [Nocardioides sp.]
MTATKAQATPTEVDKPTPNDLFESMTGFDEIAVARSFGAEITTMREQPFTFMRALLFVQARRDGMSDAKAREHALGLTVREVNDSFSEDVDDEGKAQ